MFPRFVLQALWENLEDKTVSPFKASILPSNQHDSILWFDEAKAAFPSNSILLKRIKIIWGPEGWKGENDPKMPSTKAQNAALPESHVCGVLCSRPLRVGQGAPALKHEDPMCTFASQIEL